MPESLGEFFQGLFDGGKYLPYEKKPFLEVSCLTWWYAFGDYETDLVIELHNPYSIDSPDLERLRAAAQSLAADMQRFLAAVSAGGPSRLLRSVREEEIRRAEQERAERAEQERARRHAEEEALRQAALKADEDRRRAAALAEEARQHAAALAEEAHRRAAHTAVSNRAARRVAVLYDTSYLMSGQPLMHKHPSKLLSYCTIINIVPQEIQEEIAGNMDRSKPEEKVRDASNARKKVVALKEETSEWAKYETVRLRDFVRPQHYTDLLMPDSENDSLLIEYGKHLLEDPSWLAVVLASRDEGIRNAVFEERQLRPQLRLFSIADLEESNQIAPLRRALKAAYIERLWVELTETAKDGRRGVGVHVQLTITCREDSRCGITVLFFQADGQPLLGSAPYCTDAGQLAVGEYFVPRGECYRNEDFALFVPHGAFDLRERECAFLIQVLLSDEDSLLCKWKSAAPMRLLPRHLKSAQIENVRVVLDQRSGDGRLGVGVRVRFSITGCQNERCNITAVFFRVDGQPLLGFAPYCTDAGQLVVGTDFVPQHESTRFDDFPLFVPHSAFRVGQGECTFRIRLNLFSEQALLLEWNGSNSMRLNFV